MYNLIKIRGKDEAQVTQWKNHRIICFPDNWDKWKINELRCVTRDIEGKEDENNSKD